MILLTFHGPPAFHVGVRKMGRKGVATRVFLLNNLVMTMVSTMVVKYGRQTI